MNDTAAAPPWREQAACRGMPTGLFYPPPGMPATVALAVCARCPVRRACEEHALDAGEELGVWGGRTQEERVQLNRYRAASGRSGRRHPGPRSPLSDDALVELVRSLDPDQPAAGQIIARLRVSVPTAYKYLHRAARLGMIEQRGRHHYPAG